MKPTLASWARWKPILRAAGVSWLVTLVALGSFVALSLPSQVRDLREALDSQALGLSVALRDVAKESLVAQDYSTVVDHATRILRNSDLLRQVVIANPTGTVIRCTATNFQVNETDARSWIPATPETTTRLGYDARLQGRVLLRADPVVMNGDTLAWLQLALRADTYDFQVRRLFRSTALVTAACLMFGLVVSFAGAFLFVRPPSLSDDPAEAGDASSSTRSPS